jgi:tripartite-type tricarboxylate transporter receptor subunit TctC
MSQLKAPGQPRTRPSMRRFGSMKHAALIVALSMLAGTWSGAALAQAYPAKPIKLVVPFAPGGPTDIMGRVIAQQLAPTLGGQVFVDNRAGAGGTIGAEEVAKSPGDGYTLLLATASTLAMAPALYKKLGYSATDFAPVGLFADAPFLIVVHPSVKATTVKELVALAKAKPGELSYGSAGVGNILHVAGELFKSMTDTNLLHVPYKGGAPARADLIAGRIQAMFEMYSTFRADVPAGKVRVLAVASSKKHPLLPEVPTAAEAGLPGYEAVAWFGIVAGKGTPRNAIVPLNAGLQKALASKEVLDLLAKLAFQPGGGSPEDFAALIQSEINKWGKVIKSAGITAD